jgi:hypothetical protein
VSDLLSQAEVDALAEGTIVEVIWSGGNGPCTYEVGIRDGKAYALIPLDNPHHPSQRDDWARGYVDSDWRLDRIGSDQRNTWVRLPGPRDEWPHRTLTWRSDGRTSCPNCDGECRFADHEHNRRFVTPRP